MPKGFKTCPSCDKNCGPRTQVCECGHNFFPASQKGEAKVKPRRSRNNDGTLRRPRGEGVARINWRELKAGDRIKVVAGSGPRYTTSTGARIPMGCKGVYTVLYLDENGIHALAYSKKGSTGHEYIWMGPKTKGIYDGLLRRPHKIRPVRSRVTV